MKKKFNLSVKVGTYEKNGETKGRYQNIGVMIEGDNGPYILLDKTFNPAGIQDGKDKLMVSLYEQKQKDEQGFNSDGIPF